MFAWGKSSAFCSHLIHIFEKSTKFSFYDVFHWMTVWQVNFWLVNSFLQQWIFPCGNEMGRLLECYMSNIRWMGRWLFGARNWMSSVEPEVLKSTSHSFRLKPKTMKNFSILKKRFFSNVHKFSGINCSYTYA